MKIFEFTIIKPNQAIKALIRVNELSLGLAIKEANRRAKKLGYVLIF